MVVLVGVVVVFVILVVVLSICNLLKPFSVLVVI